MKRPGARPDTWMPIYWGDYARDTGHLSATTHGAYLMLIKHYWCTGAPLPDDDAQLWRIACADSPAAWKKLRLVVGGFFVIADGVWKHKRIDAEMVRAKQLAEIRQEVGKRGGQASANRRATEIPKDTPNGNQLVDQRLNQTHQQTSTPSPSQSPSQSERKKDSPAPDGAGGEPSASDLEMEFDLWWLCYPRKQDRGHALKAFKRVRKSGIALETLTTATRKYAAERAGQDAQFTKLGATWLNGQCWLDESSTDIAEREREQFKRDIEEKMRATA